MSITAVSKRAIREAIRGKDLERVSSLLCKHPALVEAVIDEVC